MYISRRNLVLEYLAKRKIVRSVFKLKCGGSSKLLNFLPFLKSN
jgi:hypothetical protein